MENCHVIAQPQSVYPAPLTIRIAKIRQEHCVLTKRGRLEIEEQPYPVQAINQRGKISRARPILKKRKLISTVEAYLLLAQHTNSCSHQRADACANKFSINRCSRAVSNRQATPSRIINSFIASWRCFLMADFLDYT